MNSVKNKYWPDIFYSIYIMTRNIFILIAIMFITIWAFTFYKYEIGTLSHLLLIFASISLLISGLYSKKLS